MRTGARLAAGLAADLAAGFCALVLTMTFFKGTTGALTAGLFAPADLAAVFLAAAALEAKFFLICALEGNASATPILAALERRRVVAGLVDSTPAFLTASGLATPNFRSKGF